MGGLAFAGLRADPAVDRVAFADGRVAGGAGAGGGAALGLSVCVGGLADVARSVLSFGGASGAMDADDGIRAGRGRLSHGLSLAGVLLFGGEFWKVSGDFLSVDCPVFGGERIGAGLRSDA